VTRATTPRVAVVIVTYFSADVLGGCLDSLTDQGVTLTDVVVADNGSTDATLKVATQERELPVRVVELGRNAGYSAAINAGIATLDLSTVDAVMILNPDCRPRPGAIGVLAAALRPDRGITVPLLLNQDGSLQPSLRRPPTVTRALAESLLGARATKLGSLSEMIVDPAAYTQAGPVTWATGAAMLISAEAVARLGDWDESFLLYSEETEYCLRAADHGLATWFEPAAVIEHTGGELLRNPFLSKLAVVNRVELFRRRHGRVRSAAYFAAVAAGEGLRALAGRATARAAFTALMLPSRRVRELPSREQA
jgi:N-acetylglucosaminyl-diphospho-decaprenol L-rhamnosyltransferase